MKDAVSMSPLDARAAASGHVSMPRGGAFRPTTGKTPLGSEERNDHARR
jgi:hypothetical protein